MNYTITAAAKRKNTVKGLTEGRMFLFRGDLHMVRVEGKIAEVINLNTGGTLFFPLDTPVTPIVGGALPTDGKHFIVEVDEQNDTAIILIGEEDD